MWRAVECCSIGRRSNRHDDPLGYLVPGPFPPKCPRGPQTWRAPSLRLQMRSGCTSSSRPPLRIQFICRKILGNLRWISPAIRRFHRRPLRKAEWFLTSASAAGRLASGPYMAPKSKKRARSDDPFDGFVGFDASVKFKPAGHPDIWWCRHADQQCSDGGTSASSMRRRRRHRQFWRRGDDHGPAASRLRVVCAPRGRANVVSATFQKKKHARAASRAFSLRMRSACWTTVQSIQNSCAHSLRS